MVQYSSTERRVREKILVIHFPSLESFPLRASVVLGPQVPLIDRPPAQTVSLRALLGSVLTA